LSLCRRKMYEAMDVQVHVCLTSAVVGGGVVSVTPLLLYLPVNSPRYPLDRRSYQNSNSDPSVNSL
jgi:hypothetical protein